MVTERATFLATRFFKLVSTNMINNFFAVLVLFSQVSVIILKRAFTVVNFKSTVDDEGQADKKVT